ncbi:prenyltransferase family protein [Alcanivorax balearicus MACL04]|jgi:heme o synthase|uniref:Protoheme IX farnesyltransferase n=1 Tax=Alloalcanivorax balearicus MACL04 TaxID=1177182 RepID=A0ABT2QUU8_9GAMM|nr:heme o synthase [Alloalcanivorax balearicus]ERS12962.1 protoheme IX farnesyltransferase [Alcanivorax sp. PN-3]MCU5781304.1 prenyltransferase family protein [Alloalcanivorax balearicus MACL04]
MSTTTWRDYLALTKPGVVMLLMVTAVAGMFLATDPPGMVPLHIFIPAFVGLSLAMMASAAINQIMDQKIDAIMKRTEQRPLVAGKLSPRAAVAFAVALAMLSMAMLYFLVNPMTAWLTLFGFVGYAFVYTLYLKRATPQNIVIGGVAGAIPPLLGWVAVTNELHPHAWLLVLIIFVWTPPHFWALAIHRADEYAKADIPMLPVTHGIPFTRESVLYYTILLFVCSLLPYLTGMSGLIYLIAAVILGAIFLVHAVRLRFSEDPKLPMKTFGYSITYLFVLFTALLVDHYIPLYPFIV